MKKITLLFFMAFIVASVFTFNGCDATSSDDNDPNNPSASSSGNVLGTVKSTWGSGISGVTVSVGNLTSITNGQGWFSIPEVTPGTRVQVKYELDGYVSTSKVINVIVGQATFVEAVLVSIGATTTVGTSGGTVYANNGATVTFGSNAFSNSGTATVEATYFDPTSSYFVDAFPGDFTGNQSGTEGTLESFGFIDVNLTDNNGNAINLASGQTAEIRIPIPYSLQSTAPNSIPLWYYDENDGIWKADGTGTRVGNEYVGTVTHFTSWNWDRLYNVCYLSGRVVDGDGNPVNHAYVTMDGQDYSGRSYRYTGSDGTFRIGVKPNSTVVVKASKGGVSSTPITVSPTPSDGSERNIGDIVLTAPWATITLTWGENPRDLDSHLLVPPASGSSTGGHIAYYSKGSLTNYPNAELDTDDTQSYGPENVTVVRKYTGLYKYYVHWFYGSENLPASEARITLLLNGNLYNFTVPSGSTEYRYWHVFDMNVNDAGNVSLQTVNEIVETEPTASGYSLLKITPPAK